MRRLRSEELSSGQVAALRALFEAAWRDPSDRFTEEDWDHTMGGVHFVVEEEDVVVAHAAVVERELHTGAHRLATGYVEAVATLPARERQGLGTAVMREAGDYIDRTFQLGALATERQSFYERLGWQVWRGPTFVRTKGGDLRTPDEDGYILVRLTPATPALDLSAPISCEWRPGDPW